MSASSLVLLALHMILQVILVIRALVRPQREPAARLAWAVVIILAPVVGMMAYLLLGETNIGSRRIAKVRKALAELPPAAEMGDGISGKSRKIVEPEYGTLFQIGQSISGFPPVCGNHAQLMDSSDATIDAMVADIDAATETVHLEFYIWLPDGNGVKMVNALKRAARRGVICRAMADDLGSRVLIKSSHWEEMSAAGVRLAKTLQIGNPLLRVLTGRIDLRNHRKILVVDNRVTYCGSQNCADPEFLVKAKYAPWVDIMLRFEGPIVRQNQHLFASDWMGEVNEDLSALLREPLPKPRGGFVAQVIGTGPTVRASAMPEVFASLMFAAQHELTITTPYYVPDEPIQQALCASARRGIRTTIVFPARNDSRLVAAASRSYYSDLLQSGVRVFEYNGGLLHSKSLTVDGRIALIGSANMDRRSFELNFENNILLEDEATTARIMERQESYIAASTEVDPDVVRHWPLTSRLWNNGLAMFGPIL
jgi:cardiolipin synthase